MALNRLILYPANSQFIQLNGLQDQSTPGSPTYVNNATLTATLFDGNGVAVPGATGIAGTYVATSNGNYQFQISGAAFNPPADFGATLVVSGTYNTSVAFSCSIPVFIEVRNQGTEL